jgi:hypothetical protein
MLRPPICDGAGEDDRRESKRRVHAGGETGERQLLDLLLKDHGGIRDVVAIPTIDRGYGVLPWREGGRRKGIRRLFWRTLNAFFLLQKF